MVDKAELGEIDPAGSALEVSGVGEFGEGRRVEFENGDGEYQHCEDSAGVGA